MQGTASTLTRAEVRGGGRKPYAQKGTGNARIGSRRTPLKPGGGVVFGPKPKDWTIKMNKKERRLATATALASAAGDAVVVDGLTLPDAKTKTLVSRLAALGADPMTQHVLVIADLVSENLVRAAKNVERLTVNRAGALNAREILKADRVVIEEGALAAINATPSLVAAGVHSSPVPLVIARTGPPETGTAKTWRRVSSSGVAPVLAE